MEFDVKTVFSIIVSVIMVGSIVGITAFYSFPDQETNGDNGPEPLPATTIDFIAEDINATVYQMLPSLKIQAETTETDLVKVNNSVYSIEGVKRVSGGFQQHPSTVLETGFVYVADIGFDADLNLHTILQRLREETGLQYIDGYTFALVKLPETVSMHSVDQELALSREYSFSEGVSEALVGFDAMEGDRLVAGVTATFIGDDATNVMAFEEENLTAKPVQKTAVLNLPIASLESLLFFEAGLPYSLVDSVASLEDEIKEIPQVADANVFFFGGQPVLTLTFEEPAEEVFQDLSSFALDINAELTEQDSLNASISFEEGISSQLFLEKKAAVIEELQILGASALVEEETGFLSGSVGLEPGDSKQPALELSQLLDDKGFDASIQQPAALSVEEIFDTDTNKALLVPNAVASGLLLSGHSIGETVQVQADYVLVRGLIDSISVEERQIGE